MGGETLYLLSTPCFRMGGYKPFTYYQPHDLAWAEEITLFLKISPEASPAFASGGGLRSLGIIKAC
jgi:hypothetical protein